MQLRKELEVAQHLARQAGQLVLRYYGQASLRVSYKDDARQSPVTQADTAANELIVDALRVAFPDDAIWSEESPEHDELPLMHRQRLWCIDPIDGTQEFINQNGEFAVMIGLAIHGRAALGVVYQPTEDRLYWAIPTACGLEERDRSQALKLSTRQLGGQSTQEYPILAISRSHPTRNIERLLSPIGPFQTRRSGSVGLKLCLLADGLVDMYLSSANYMAAWDTCAPEAIVRSAGGIVSNGLGFSLTYDQPSQTTAKGIVAATPALWPYCLQALAQQPWRRPPK